MPKDLGHNAGTRARGNLLHRVEEPRLLVKTRRTANVRRGASDELHTVQQRRSLRVLRPHNISVPVQHLIRGQRDDEAPVVEEPELVFVHLFVSDAGHIVVLDSVSLEEGRSEALFEPSGTPLGYPHDATSIKHIGFSCGLDESNFGAEIGANGAREGDAVSRANREGDAVVAEAEATAVVA